MSEWLNTLYSASFMPHGQCYLWQPSLIGLHAIADTAITIAYYSIPAIILYFVRKRRDLPFPWIFLMFGVFIVACGTTHLMEVLTIWHPAYWLSGGIKLFTAAVSLATAVALIRIVPAALSLPSPDALRQLNAELDQRVQRRTAELTAANETLISEIRQRFDAEAEVRRLNDTLGRRVDELHALFDLLPIGVGLAEDPGCTVIRTNRAAATLLRLQPTDNASLSAPPGEAPAHHHFFQQGRELAPEELPMQKATATNLPVLNFEGTLKFDKSDPIEILINAVPLRDAYGNARGCIATFQDVTQRHRAEEDRLAFERRLQETQKLESLGVLAGGIAHDFNNILTGILGYANLSRLELTDSDSSVVNSIDQIEQSALRAGELCKQLLAYAGKGRFSVQPLNLSKLVEETSHLLEISVGRKAVFRLQLAPNLPAVMGDVTQIRQVLMNLVINASEALRDDQEGLITVHTGRARVTRDYLLRFDFSENLVEGDYVTFEVTDNGTGMNPETLARIFDPFFTTKFTGRGLGLAAALGIVRGHKGALKVYSELGKGTTFKLLFPACISPLPEGDAPVSSAPPWHSSGQILVVDDEDSVRHVACQMLRQLGFTPLQAHDGVEAIEIARRESGRLKAILLDLTMPKMNGEQTIGALRAIDANTPVVLMSGFNEQATTSRFVGRGLAGFLSKPFTLDMMVARLRTAIEKTKSE